MGHSQNDLERRRYVLMRRKLSEQGIGYPVTATVEIHLVRKHDYWRISDLKLRPIKPVTKFLRKKAKPAASSAPVSAP